MLSVTVAISYYELHLVGSDVSFLQREYFKNKPINSKNVTYLHTNVPQLISKLEMKEEVTN
jgi:hypothetical protein